MQSLTCAARRPVVASLILAVVAGLGCAGITACYTTDVRGVAVGVHADGGGHVAATVEDDGGSGVIVIDLDALLREGR